MTTADPLEKLKTAMRKTWMSGDFGRIARFNEQSGADFVDRLQLQPGVKVLDVACGSGNLAIPAARAGAEVTGVDIAPNLLEQARRRAEAESLTAKFDEGDAEKLPYAGAPREKLIETLGVFTKDEEVASLRVNKKEILTMKIGFFVCLCRVTSTR